MKLKGLISLLLILDARAIASEAKHLGFEECINRARTASHKRAEVEADLDLQAARRRQSYAEMGPDVDVEYRDVSYDKKVAVEFGADIATIRPDRLREGSLVVKQPLTSLYRSYEKGAEESARERWQSYALQDAEIEASFMAAELYRRVQQADEMLKIAESSVAATDSQAKDAETLLRLGKLLRSDLLKIQMAQQDSRSQLARAFANRKKAVERLRYLLVLDGSETMELDPLPNNPDVSHFVVPDLTKALESAQSERAQYHQAEAEVEISRHEAHATDARYLPDVDLFLRWDKVYSEDLPFGTPRDTRSYGIAASWDLWDNGSRFFAHQEAAARQRRADVGLRETRDRFREEIEGLMADIEATKQALDSAKIRMAQAEEAYRIDKARFANGYVTTTDLLLSESNLTRARGAWVEALVEADVIILNLKKAIGVKNPV